MAAVRRVDASPNLPWRLADPQLAVALLCTVRLRNGVLIDELSDTRAANDWLRERQMPALRGSSTAHRDLVQRRDLLRKLFTAVIDDTPLPRRALTTVNRLAERAPISLVGHQTGDGNVLVKLVSKGTPTDVLFGELARSALALLATPAREHLQQCRAPGCILFFLKRHPRQQWCSSNCGNRARVASHYARHSARDM